MTEIIIASCGGALVGGCFTLAVWALNRRAAKTDRRAEERSSLTVGLQILLYDRIKHLAKCYLAAGCISAEDLEDLMRMHTIYHDDLRGNGYLDSLMAAVGKLRIKGEKTA